ncbi:MAG: gamma-glutamyl-gamma-aminobutyrate hydrolase family protein, partial [Thermoplasmatales archaeon]|nr:gamma-glutamyl-gamma-aminobutyrate hydrolase family protein [Thermoplasmatales archaeon]
MVKIFVVDNGGQWTHREWRTLRDLEVDTKIVPNTTSFEDIVKEEVDGLVLSGGTPRIGFEDDLGKTGEYLEKADFPILGICAGHQFMGRFFGGKVTESKTPEFGKMELTLIKKDVLFDGVPGNAIVWLSHNDEVSILPKDFEVLASSESCKIQAMKHKNKPIYG